MCGLSIGKRRVELALVKHYDFVNMDGGKGFHLERQQTIYIPKYFMEEPLCIDYQITSLAILKDADFIHILHGSDSKVKEETVALKHVVYLLFKEYIDGLKIPSYMETARVLQSRLGDRGRFNHRRVLDWNLDNLDNITRQTVMGRRGVMARKVLAIAAACDTKKSKYDRV